MIGRRATLRLRVGRTTLHAEIRRGGTRIWAGEAVYGSPPELEDVIARLPSVCAVRCGRLCVLLESPPVQVRTLADLPPVRPRALAALVAHQAARFFRKNGAPLVTDAVWARRNGMHVARAAAVDEGLVLAIAAGARAAGLILDGISTEDPMGPLALLPGSERAARLRASRRRLQMLGVTAVGVWAAVGAVALARLGAERRALAREIATLQRPLAALVSARAAVHDVAATVSALTQADHDRGRPLAMLAALTVAMPDSAVLTSLTWQADASMVVGGIARRAGPVLAQMERLGPGAPVFQGPVVREAVAGQLWDRFTIVLRSGQLSRTRSP